MCPRTSERPSPPAPSPTPPTCSEPQRYTRGDATRPPSRGFPLEGEAYFKLTVAHFKNGGPVYNNALSQLGDIQGPLLLMLPTDLTAALRQELDSREGLRVGLEAVADGNLLVLLHRDAAEKCQWGALVPQLTGRHTYMATPPPGAPPPGVG